MYRTQKILLLFACNAVFTTTLYSQQVADSAFSYPIAQPSYSFGTGPAITLDEAHYNFHTLDGRYYPFGKLLRDDGYRLRAGTEKFTTKALRKTNILVIANALPDDNEEWILPTLPAFTNAEVRAVERFVWKGGSLLLIADHMPFPGAAENLAGAFGFRFVNGYALRMEREVFSRIRHNLKSSPVTDESSISEHIDSIIIFGGQGFIAPSEAIPFLCLDTSYTIYMVQRALEIDEDTPRFSGEGHVTGACLQYAKGRIVVMGEAGAFSAQLAGPQRQKFGMNHPKASQNPQLLLNIIHWLDRRMSDE